MSLVYVRFLNLINAVKEFTPEWPELDTTEDYLLDQLAICWNQSKKVAVLDTNKLVPCLSAGTVQTKLSNLIKKGIVKLMPDPEDKRIKHVNPTELTKKYFARLEVELKK